MLSQPLAPSPIVGFVFDAGASASLKMASFCRPPCEIDELPMPDVGRGACGSVDRGVETANGSILATKAGRTVGSAGDEGSSSF